MVPWRDVFWVFIEAALLSPRWCFNNAKCNKSNNTAYGQCYGATWSPNKLSFHFILSENPFFSWRLDSVRGCWESNKSMLFRLNLKNKWSASGKLKSYQTSFEVFVAPHLMLLKLPSRHYTEKATKNFVNQRDFGKFSHSSSRFAFYKGKFKGYRETGSNFLLNLIFSLKRVFVIWRRCKNYVNQKIYK